MLFLTLLLLTFQIVLSGTEKAFTYDFVFDASKSQQNLYETAVKDMLSNLFQGKLTKNSLNPRPWEEVVDSPNSFWRIIHVLSGVAL